MEIIRRLFRTKKDQNPTRMTTESNATDAPVIIVSGLPRSGTSMMMKMLEAGGVEPLIDGIRSADDDNPRGYYEFERVKKLDKGDTAWVADAHGKVVKVISALLRHLPAEHQYLVLFMHREMDEILASQRKMLRNRAEDENAIDDAEMRRLYAAHLEDTHAWLERQRNMQVEYFHYNKFTADPAMQIEHLDAFLPMQLDVAAMKRVIDPSLHRNRTEGNA